MFLLDSFQQNDNLAAFGAGVLGQKTALGKPPPFLGRVRSSHCRQMPAVSALVGDFAKRSE
jgi:hypothetical protein